MENCISAKSNQPTPAGILRVCAFERVSITIVQDVIRGNVGVLPDFIADQSRLITEQKAATSDVHLQNPCSYH